METIKLPGLKPIVKSAILYMAGDGVYTKVYTIGGKILVSSINLSRSALLAPEFIRIHKCFLINPTYIESYQAPVRKLPGILNLYKVDKELAISRRRWLAIQPLLSERFRI